MAKTTRTAAAAVAITIALAASAPAGAQRADEPPCFGREPRHLLLTVLGHVYQSSGNPENSFDIGGRAELVDVCRGRSGQQDVSEVQEAGRCRALFGPEARASIAWVDAPEAGDVTIRTTCVAETVEAICAALSDCAAPRGAGNPR